MILFRIFVPISPVVIVASAIPEFIAVSVRVCLADHGPSIN